MIPLFKIDFEVTGKGRRTDDYDYFMEDKSALLSYRLCPASGMSGSSSQHVSVLGQDNSKLLSEGLAVSVQTCVCVCVNGGTLTRRVSVFRGRSTIKTLHKCSPFGSGLL